MDGISYGTTANESLIRVPNATNYIERKDDHVVTRLMTQIELLTPHLLLNMHLD